MCGPKFCYECENLHKRDVICVKCKALLKIETPELEDLSLNWQHKSHFSWTFQMVRGRCMDATQIYIQLDALCAVKSDTSLHIKLFSTPMDKLTSLER